MQLLFAMLFSFLLIPFSIATAQDIDSDVISFVQIIQRDNAGNLIGYLEYDAVIVLSDSNFQGMLNYLKDQSRIVEVNGIDYELIQLVGSASTDSSGLLSTSNLEVQKPDGTMIRIVNLAHDGIRSASDEKITVIWNFLRLV
tara:strand:- start:1022 stop:1447 length:426 start_codon:yes stop_codon:yes gene_type:complete